MAKREIDPKYKVDPKKASKEEMDEAFALLAKKKETVDRIKKGELKSSYGVAYKDMTPEQKAKSRKYNTRRLVRQSLMVAKAVAAGIIVSDKEVDAEIAKKVKK